MDYRDRYESERLYATNGYRPRRRRLLSFLPLLLLIPLLLLLGIVGPRLLNNQQSDNRTNTLSQNERFVSPVPTGTNRPEVGVGGSGDEVTATVTPTRNDPTIESGADSATARNASEAEERAAYPQEGIGGSGGGTDNDNDRKTTQEDKNTPQSGVGGSGAMPSGAPNTGRGGR